MKRHLYVFLEGLLIVAPLAITFYVIYAGVSWIDGGMRKVFGGIFPESIPGLGIISALILIYLVGLVSQYLVRDLLIDTCDQLMRKIPVVKTIYESVSDLFKYFAPGGKQKGEAVKVPVAGGKGYMVGIVMQASEGESGEPVPVYLPMSYNMGGFLVYVPREHVEKMDIDAGAALKMVMTAGVTSEKT